MYEAIDDPYCYRGTVVLCNKLGIRDVEQLEAFEEEISEGRADEQQYASATVWQHAADSPLRQCDSTLPWQCADTPLCCHTAKSVR